MFIYKVPEEADFSVRVVLSVDKKLEVNKKFLDIFHESDYPTKFPYRSKVRQIFCMTEIVETFFPVFYVVHSF